jgi:hypothetical protein
MLSSELLAEVHRLNRAEKLRLVQLLAGELVAEEAALDPNVLYEVWSPYDSAEAAAALAKVLEDHKKFGGE